MKHSVQELNDIAKEARRVTMKASQALARATSAAHWISLTH